MSDLGRILIVDADESFRQATADLLRNSGYACDWVPDAEAARDMLDATAYSALVVNADIARENDFAFIRALPEASPGARAILTTSSPDVGTAAAAIELPVAAYLVKPVDPEVFLSKVHAALRHSSLQHAVHSLGARLQAWGNQLAQLEQSVQSDSGTGSPVPIDLFLDMTFKNVFEALANVRQLTTRLAGIEGERAACHLLECPRLSALRDALAETVEVLKETKGAFKSKRLGDLRKTLEKHLNGDAARTPSC